MTDKVAGPDGSAFSEGLGPLPKTSYTLASGGRFTWVRGWSEKQVRAYTLAEVQRAVAAEHERCADIAKARADKIAAEAERAAENCEHDEVVSLRAMAWQLTVAEREIRGA